MDGYTESIFPFIEDNPFINELHILHHGQTMLDISKSHLTRLIVDVSGLKELILNTKMKSLNFTGELSPDLRILAYEDGKYITLNVASGMPQVRESHGLKVCISEILRNLIWSHLCSIIMSFQSCDCGVNPAMYPI
ncbi:hypothetical protein MT997_24675 [Paenibacillus sp. OVF10]|nr:hypothetical protein MT997_24675 [Paenibacillus sp. OVF10]